MPFVVVFLALAAQAEEAPRGSNVAARLQRAAIPAGPEVRAEQLRHGTLRSRLADTPADLVLLYGGEHDGELGTCGCDTNPRGSLGRVDRYRRVLTRSEPALLLGAGGSLSAVPGEDGRLRADVLVRDHYVADALVDGGWTTNLGYRDLPWVAEHGLPNGVSANVTADPPLPTHVIHNVNGLRVAVTGVTGDGLRHMRPRSWTVEDPVERLLALVPTLDADVIVVLGYAVGPLAPRIAAIPGVDVLIEADAFEGRYPPEVVGDALWVRSRFRTEQLGELRLTLDEGRIVAAVDRKIDLDWAIRPTTVMRRVERRADRDIHEALVSIYGDLVR